MKKTTIIIVFTVVFSILFGNTPYKFENKQIKKNNFIPPMQVYKKNEKINLY